MKMYETGRYASAPRMGGRMLASTGSADQHGQQQQVRSMTPSGRGNTNIHNGNHPAGGGAAVQAGGLIRLTLKKPMGIVFEPTYDPNNKTVQRGVRICDLPRTGAAALSRQLQVGDELLQINQVVVSRLVFDEIMELIIEADPDNVNLLFRRPKREMSHPPLLVPKKDNSSTVKWVDEEESHIKHNNSSSAKKNKKKKKKPSPKKQNIVETEDEEEEEEEEETLQSKSSTLGTADDYTNTGSSSKLQQQHQQQQKRKTSKKSSSFRRKSPDESESFLDMLIDAVCSEHTCRDGRGRDDFSDDDSETYNTYEQESTINNNSNNNTTTATSTSLRKKAVTTKYEDDGTLESIDTTDRPIQPVVLGGLAPNPQSPILAQQQQQQQQQQLLLGTDDITDEGGGNPAPIQELEYNDDTGADVSVMDSIGGPSLLLEQRKNAWKLSQQTSTPNAAQVVPDEIVQHFGLDWNLPGLNRLESIRADPATFYSHIVRTLLQENEPEKVRLLDKLLSKYKGREDHLVQKLSVRYVGNSNERAVNPIMKDKDMMMMIPQQQQQQQQHTDDEDDHVIPEKSRTPEPKQLPKQQQQQMQSKLLHQPRDDIPTDEPSEYSEDDAEDDSVDGTSPAVIAQVSELLNYVYGKTSVPGQIDRVSTIMRAYEGREAVLLELLETKALIKANKEKENVDNLPSFLRNSQLHDTDMLPDVNDDEDDNDDEEDGNDGKVKGRRCRRAENVKEAPGVPLKTSGGTVIHDDISSMSGVSSPAVDLMNHHHRQQPPPPSSQQSEHNNIEESSPASPKNNTVTPRKKKGLFGGLFKKNIRNKQQQQVKKADGSI